MSNVRKISLSVMMLLFFCTYERAIWANPKQDSLNSKQKKLLQVADELLEEAKISYVYGGHKVGEEGDCKSCNQCLSERKPAKKSRFASCPDCVKCSLDCSHFVQLIFRVSGMSFPYLQTRKMLDLPAGVLKSRYQLVDIGRNIGRAIPGDLLVYKGHVVVLERILSRENEGKGDIVHATGGRDIKNPGEGIQRERFVRLDGFRGPLLRILRHISMYETKAKRLETVTKGQKTKK